MTNQSSNSDISVRGGIINVPHSTIPTHPPRHQPNTPPTKKRTKTRTDHHLSPKKSTTTVKDTPPPQPDTPEEPTPTATAPPDPTKDEPEKDPSD